MQLRVTLDRERGYVNFDVMTAEREYHVRENMPDDDSQAMFDILWQRAKYVFDRELETRRKDPNEPLDNPEDD